MKTCKKSGSVRKSHFFPCKKCDKCSGEVSNYHSHFCKLCCNKKYIKKFFWFHHFSIYDHLLSVKMSEVWNSRINDCEKNMNVALIWEMEGSLRFVTLSQLNIYLLFNEKLFVNFFSYSLYKCLVTPSSFNI